MSNRIAQHRLNQGRPQPSNPSSPETETRHRDAQPVLVGKFFHSIMTENDGCRYVQYQGLITSRPEPGLYTVLYYEWLTGAPNTEEIVKADDMIGWVLYDSNEEMNDTYHDLWERRLEQHLTHATVTK